MDENKIDTTPNITNNDLDNQGLSQPTTPTSRSHHKVDLKKALPDLNVKKLEDHYKVLTAYCKRSDNGKQGLKYTDFNGLIQGLQITRISGLNSFFKETGFIKHVEGQKGVYLPTQELIDYQIKKEWNEGEAKKIMANILKNSWFFQNVRMHLSINKEATEEALIQSLASESGAPIEYRPALKILLEYLVDNGLVSLNEK
jgi:hypothetical protein